MNTQEYIESGTLEAFVLGALSSQEEAQVLADIARNPELAREVAAIEDALLKYAVSESLTPPHGLKDKIWDSIQGAIPGAHDGEVRKEEEKRTATIIPLTPSARPTRWNYAAVWVALVSSIALNTIFWYQNSRQKQDTTALSAKLDTMAAREKALAQVVDNYTRGKNMMADNAMQTIVMHTVLKGHPMAATLYWSKDKGEAYVMIDALPEPPKGMQYQLWAIQSGKPVDMGVLPNSIASTASIQKVGKPVMSGEAFAISLEKEGGSPSPTPENIYVMGKSI